MSCFAENREKLFMEQISIFDHCGRDRGLAITDDRAHDRWQWAVLELLLPWWCFPNTCTDRLPVLCMSRRHNDGHMHRRRAKWGTRCQALLWSLTSVHFWSVSVTKSGNQRPAVAPQLKVRPTNRLTPNVNKDQQQTAVSHSTAWHDAKISFKRSV